MVAAGRALALMALFAFAGAVPALGQQDEPGQYAGRDVDWWIAELENDETWRGAQAALRKIGRPAQAPLAMALTSDQQVIRDRALSTLGMMQLDPGPILELMFKAVDPDDLRFTRRLFGLFQSAGKAALPWLDEIAAYLDCGDRDVARAVLAILVRLAPESKQELPRVFALARKAEPRLRVSAINAAVRIAPDDPKVVAVLGEVLSAAGDEDRRDLLHVATRLNPGVPGLADLVVRCTKDPSAEVRSAAAGLLDEIVLEDRQRLDALLALLKDREVKVRSSAAWSVSKLGTIAVSAVPSLIPLLENDDSGDDLGALKAVVAIGPAAAPAFPAVLALLERFEPPFRMYQQPFVEFLGLDPDLAIQALSSDHEPARHIAFEVLTKWSWPELRTRFPAFREPLTRALTLATDTKTYSYSREIEVMVKLQQVLPRDPRLGELCLELAKSSSPGIRRMAVKQVATRPGCIPALLEFLESKDAAQRDFAFQAFLLHRSGMHLKEVQEGILKLIHHEDEAVAGPAARVLLKHYYFRDASELTEKDAPVLARHYAGMLDEKETIQLALTRMGALGAYAVPYIDLLFAMVNDEKFGFLAGSAAHSLRRIAASGDDAAGKIMPGLLAALRGDSAHASAAAARALVWEEPYRAEILALLPDLIRNPSPHIHTDAVMVAGNLGEQGKPLVPALLDIARDPPEGSYVQWRAIDALAAIVPGDERLLEICVQILLTKQRGGSHFRALTTGGEKSARLLAAALGGASTKKKVEILSVLGSIGPEAFCVVEQVRPFADHPDPEVARTAGFVLKRISESRD